MTLLPSSSTASVPQSGARRPDDAPAPGLRPRRTGIARAALPVAVVTLLFLGVAAVLGFELAAWDRIAPGTTALGMPVGGLAASEAATRLAPLTEARLDRPLTIRVGDRAWSATAGELGLRLDPTELAAMAYRVSREGSPPARLAAQWRALTAGRSVALSGATDPAVLDAALARLAREVDRAPRDARLALTAEGTVASTLASTGVALDRPASRDVLLGALASDQTSVELVVRELPPAIGDDLVQSARDQLARVLGPDDATRLTLRFGGRSWRLARAEVRELVSLAPARPGQPATVALDARPLEDLAARLAREIDQGTRDARFNVRGDTLVVVRESREGRALDQAATVTLIEEALLAGERAVDLPVGTARPAVATEDGPKLGRVERIETASTSFAGSIPEKKANIKLAAERLNGVVVPPGGTFSFNKEVGPTTLETGYQWGFGIEAGGDGGARTVPSVAGGICQVSTTLFQPVFWAGYPLEERYWHLYWIPAYTSKNGIVGLDATVDAEAGLDFQWVNPTDDYVLIQSATDDERVYFSLYGKKPSWTVALSQEITSRTPADPTPLAQAEPSLPWGRTLQVESAREGFDVVVTRTVAGPDGRAVRPPLKLRSSYQPSRTVTLVGTADKPAGASVEEALARVLGQDTPPGRVPPPANQPTGAAVREPAAGDAPSEQAPAASAVDEPRPPASAAVPSATPRAGTPVPTADPVATRTP